MTTVAIVPTSDISGEKSYRAIAGDKSSVGKTAGQALDALANQLGETEFSALLVIQNFRSDPFFSAQQQEPCYSAGIVQYDLAQHQSIDELLEAADRLMYQQKLKKRTPKLIP